VFNYTSPIIVLLLSVSALPAFAKVTVETNPDAKLISYRFSQAGFKLDLIQRLPDQTRAFFMARGFPNAVANKIGLSCIFQGIGTNVSGVQNSTSIEVSLKDWKIHTGNDVTRIKMKETWDKEWLNADVSNASKIAYKWATFPSHQIFSNNGDYGWGMISFNLPPETVFDLEISWNQNTKTHKAWIRSLQCPSDR